MSRTLLATIGSLLILTGLCLLPANRSWLQKKIFPYYRDLPSQASNLNIEHRKVLRWRNSYTFSKHIAGQLKDIGGTDSSIVLIPPAQYFRNAGIDYQVPEPAVFYYYTGLRSTCVYCEELPRSRFIALVNEDSLKVVPVSTFAAMADSLSRWKKYKQEL